MSTQRSSATDLGMGFVAALAERDFPRLADTLTPDVRMRALIPPGPVEISGAEAAAAKFSSWFADAEEFDLVRSGSDTVADRLHVFYRLRLKKPGDQRKTVEQHLLCAYDDDRITALDLVCTGFPSRRSRSALEADQLKGRLTPRAPVTAQHEVQARAAAYYQLIEASGAALASVSLLVRSYSAGSRICHIA